MDEINWVDVEKLRERLEAIGFHETWAYGFVSSLLDRHEMPTGRGIHLLRDFIATDWETRAQRVAAVEAILPVAGLDEPWLQKLAADIRRGYEVPDWRQQRFEEIKDKVSKSAPRVRTDEEAAMIRDIAIIGKARGYRWWGHRPAQRKRFDDITLAVEGRIPIYDADYAWMVTLFKGVIDDLHSDKHPVGELRYVKSYGDAMAIVLSKPYIFETTGNVVIDILPAGGAKTHVPFSLLKKRK
jgi:hypothetical protein